MFHEIYTRKFLSPQPHDKHSINPLARRDANKSVNGHHEVIVKCVNCQAMVNLNLLEEHSRECYQATEKSMHIDHDINTEQPDFKLIRLKLALERQLETSKFNPNETRLRRQLVNSIEELLSFNGKLELKRIRELKGLICEIQELSSSFRDYPSLKLYLDRIKELGEEKYRDLVKSDQEPVRTSHTNNHFRKMNAPTINTVSTAKVTLLETPRRQNSQRDKGSLRGSVTRRNEQSPGTDFKPMNQTSWPFQHQYSSVADPRNQSEIQRNTSFRTSIRTQDPTQNMLPTRLSREPSSENKSKSSNFLQQMHIHSQSNLNEQRSSGFGGNHPLGREYTTFHPLLRDSTSFRGNAAPEGPVRMSNRNDNQNFYSQRNEAANYRTSIRNYDGINNSLAETSPVRALATKYASYNTNNPALSKSEYKPSNQEIRYNTPERSMVERPVDSMLSLASSYLTNMLPQEFTTPNKRPRHLELLEPSPERRSRSREAVKQELEHKLESRKKELAKVTSLVNKYKYRTATIQISLNNDSPIKDNSPSRMRYSPIGNSHNRGREQDNNVTFTRNESGLPKSQENDIMNERLSHKSNKNNEGSSFDEFYQNIASQGELNEKMVEQRHFYSKCLEIKLRFKDNEIYQHIPVALIYKDAVKNNIPQAGWEKFIENAFSTPEKYVDTKKLQAKKKKQGLKNNLIEIVQSKATKTSSSAHFNAFNSFE